VSAGAFDGLLEQSRFGGKPGRFRAASLDFGRGVALLIDVSNASRPLRIAWTRLPSTVKRRPASSGEHAARRMTALPAG
jgi:hypothetical protein